MIGFGNAFRSRTNYVFDYKPRYYDARKERLRKLEQQYAEKNASMESGERISLSREGLKKEWRRSKHFSHDVKANKRLAIILAILVGVAAYILELHTLF